MTDIAKAFDNFFEHEHRAIATILQNYGAGRYEAQTVAGNRLIINGEATVGDKVFYDTKTKRILDKAPDVEFFDIPV